MRSKGVGLNHAWVILAACCLSMGSAIGIANNCYGLFLTPVSQELGCSYSSLSLTVTIMALSNCASMLLFARRACTRFPLRIVLVLASLCNVPRLLLSFSTSVWQWWVSAVFSGIAGSFLYGYAVSITLERWFKKKLALALSITACFSGIFGIVMSYLIGHMISTVGWRSANMFGCLVLLVMTAVPSLLFCLDPKEIGCTPYGASEEDTIAEAGGETSRTTVKTAPPFDRIMISILAICVVDAILASYVFHLTSYGVSINVTLFDVSLLTTFYMVGNLAIKTTFGMVEGRLGLRRTALALLWTITVGTVLMMLGNQYILLVGSLAIGGAAALYTCVIPLLGREFYNSEQYPVVMQRCLIVVNLLVAFIGYIYGFVFEHTGTYFPVMVTMIVATLCSIVILSRILKRK